MTRLNIPLFVALAASILSAIDGRDVLPHQRMIRKRSPMGHLEERAPAFVLPRWPGLHDRQLPNPLESSTSSAANSRTSSAAASASSSAAATSSKEASTTRESTSSVATSSAASSTAETSSASATTRSGLLDSLTGILGGTQSSTTVSSTSSTPSSTVPTSTSVPTTSAAPSTSQQAVPTTEAVPTLNIATTTAPSPTTPSQSIAVYTSIAPEVQQSQAAEQKARTAKITKNTIISLVVVASCIGGAVAIWTVIRKWKLSPSERFDDRMQPIDWAPNGVGAAGAHDETVDEKRHRRGGSAGSHGSFTSGGVGQSEAGHGGAKSVYSDHTGHGAQAQDFPPPHDFTAGPVAYGQYYPGQQQYAAGAGYADLQRGPSVTESSYSHGASVTRGLSYNRGPTGYDAQPGAGGVPPLPNPYGGAYEYEDYGRPAGQGQGQQRGY